MFGRFACLGMQRFDECVFAVLSMYIHLCVHYLLCVSMHVVISISFKLLPKIDLHFHLQCCPHLACLCVM